MTLLIRNMTAADIVPLYRLLSDELVMRYLEPVYSFEKTVSFLHRYGLTEDPRIYAAEDGHNHFIGYVIYHPYDAESMEIGWVLNRSVHGQGYAQSLTKQLIRRAEDEGKNVIIECTPEQCVTKHIAEKFGFVRIGLRDGCEVYELKTRR